jgi:hypothetical protein
MTCSKSPEKWKVKMDVTYEEYFRPSPSIPHPGIMNLVREMEQTLGKERAHEIVERTATKQTVVGIKRAVAKEPIQGFRDFVDARKNRGSLSTHGTTDEIIEETDDRLVFNMTECLWARAWRDMGAADIGFLWNCKPDFALVQAMHPRLKLKRTRTLMQGDEYCDFTYYWDEE